MHVEDVYDKVYDIKEFLEDKIYDLKNDTEETTNSLNERVSELEEEIRFLKVKLRDIIEIGEY